MYENIKDFLLQNASASRVFLVLTITAVKPRGWTNVSLHFCSVICVFLKFIVFFFCSKLSIFTAQHTV